MLVDSHCHLDYSPLYENLSAVINRANKLNVKYFLTISTTIESFEKIKIITEKYKNIFGTFGIHPHETEKNEDLTINEFIKYINGNKKIIGIGETGLDFYYNHSNKKIQKKIFVEHIKAALKLDKPVIVHSRNAEKDTYDILKSEGLNNRLKILMHCFTGSKTFAKKLLDLGAFISFSGILTFKKSTELVDVAAFVPTDRLLIETDSPYLSPEPNRGKVNEPSFITYTAKKLSTIKQISLEELTSKTTINFFKLFKLY